MKARILNEQGEKTYILVFDKGQTPEKLTSAFSI